MNVRQRKQLIGLVAALLALGAVASLVAGLAVPVGVDPPKQAAAKNDPGVAAQAAVASSQKAAEKSRRLLAQLQPLCAVELRRPLTDPPGSTQGGSGGSGQPQRPMTVRLVGLASEPGHSMAVFAKGNGAIEICPQGQSIDDAGGPVTVTKIELDKVTVQYGGQSQVLTLPPVP
jgi:hypothetical protein